VIHVKLKKQQIAVGFLLTMLVLNMNIFIVNTEINTESDQGHNVPESSATYANLGAWIIIAGDRGDHDKLNYIIYGCDQVYQILTGLGVNPDDIYYLTPLVDGYTNSPYNDGLTSLSEIEYAIGTWAAGKVDASKGLGMYLFDHGGIDAMCIPGADLSASHLDSELDDLETATGCNRNIIVYEACHSGSFVGDLSQENRMILTATDQIHGSSVNPANNWATFSEGFWSSVAKCNSIGQAFEDARAFVVASGHEASQFPWIDDNHDIVPHQTDAWGNLPNGGDGNDALNTVIGNFVTCPGGAIKISIPKWMYIDLLEFPYEITIIKPKAAAVNDVIVKFITPNFNPEDLMDQQPVIVGEESIHSLIEDNLPVIHYVRGDGEHEIIWDADGEHGTVTVDVDRYSQNFEIPMEETGEYQICAYVVDDQGIMSNFVRSRVTFLEEGQQAPDDRIPPTVTIENPYNDTVVAGEIPITVDANDNLALDRVQIYVDGVQVHDEMMIGPTYPLVKYVLNTTTYPNGAHNITAIAFDHVGLQAQVSYTVEVKNENTRDPTDDGNSNLFDDLDIPGYPLGVLFFISILGIISLLHQQRKQQNYL
jgi:hypothetical protein